MSEPDTSGETFVVDGGFEGSHTIQTVPYDQNEDADRKPRRPPFIGRCSFCGLLVLTSVKTKRAYVHSIYDSHLGHLTDCVGSKVKSLPRHPK